MKTSWDALMRYAPENPYSLDPIEPQTAERIRKQTMEKTKMTEIKTPRRAGRPLRLGLIAAAVVTLLCATAFAAANGWFGFDRLFGGKAALIESHITSYDENAAVDITQPTYTEEEQAMIGEGTMQVPDIAALADTGVCAQTEDFIFTLESMLATKDTLYAIMRVDAKNAEAADALRALQTADQSETERAGLLQIAARNNSGTDNREREWKNGGMSMDIVQVQGNTAYAVVTNNGGEFAPGDKILFWAWYQDTVTNLFEVPVSQQLEQELVLELNEKAGAQSGFGWQTATITPISFRLDGTYGSGGTANDEVTITLKDGTCFTLGCAANGYAHSPYGSYGSLGFSGTASPEDDRVKHSWLFSQLIDLDALASVSIDGMVYPITGG